MCGFNSSTPSKSRAQALAEEEAAREREAQAAQAAQRTREQEAAAQGRRSLVSSITGSTGVSAGTTLF